MPPCQELQTSTATLHRPTRSLARHSGAVTVYKLQGITLDINLAIRGLRRPLAQFPSFFLFTMRDLTVELPTAAHVMPGSSMPSGQHWVYDRSARQLPISSVAPPNERFLSAGVFMVAVAVRCRANDLPTPLMRANFHSMSSHSRISLISVSCCREDC
ncbi:hypothetical protein VTK56DRAFT_5972 [Thermocarpiscus australiensis]